MKMPSLFPYDPLETVGALLASYEPIQLNL